MPLGTVPLGARHFVLDGRKILVPVPVNQERGKSMAWSEQDSIDYWAQRYPSTREQLISDLPKDEYESEYPLRNRSTQGLEFIIEMKERKNKKEIKKIDYYNDMTDENDVRDWRKE